LAIGCCFPHQKGGNRKVCRCFFAERMAARPHLMRLTATMRKKRLRCKRKLRHGSGASRCGLQLAPNCTRIARFTRLALPHLAKSGRGRVINIICIVLSFNR
jgi:hypothetical protein